MLEHSSFFDWETAKVFFFATASTGLTLTQINAGLTTIILIGTVIYTWRKALRRNRRK